MYSCIVDESDKKDSCNDFTARMMQMCLKSHSLILLLLLRILPKSRILHYFHMSVSLSVTGETSQLFYII